MLKFGRTIIIAEDVMEIIRIIIGIIVKRVGDANKRPFFPVEEFVYLGLADRFYSGMLWEIKNESVRYDCSQRK